MARHAHTCSCCGETIWCKASVTRDDGGSYCGNYPLTSDGADPTVLCEDCWYMKRDEADLAERVEEEMHDERGDVR